MPHVPVGAPERSPAVVRSPEPGRGPAAIQPALRRRRRLLLVLLATAVATLVVALVAGQPRFWGAHVLAALLLVTYLVVLVRARNASADVEMSHRALDT